MAVIRSQKAAPLVRDAIVLDLGDLARQGRMIQQQAKSDADAILKSARNQAQTIKQEALSQGRKEGIAQGLEEGRKQGLEEGRASAHDEFLDRLNTLEAAWQAALEEFLARRNTMLTNLQHDLILLATRMARAIVNRTIKANPEVIVDQVAAAIELVAHRSALTVRVHPDEIELIQNSLPELLKRMNSNAQAQVLPDDSIAIGGCVIDADGIEVDSDLDTQIARLVDALLPDDGSGRRPSEAPRLDGDQTE